MRPSEPVDASMYRDVSLLTGDTDGEITIVDVAADSRAVLRFFATR